MRSMGGRGVAPALQPRNKFGLERRTDRLVRPLILPPATRAGPSFSHKGRRRKRHHIAEMPPSSFISAPVMNLLSSEAR